MRKALVIVGGVIAVIVIVAAAILAYAARNLNSIIAERQPELLAKISDSLGRKVEVSDLKVSLGWGMLADLTGVKIQDDPAISDRPFVEASDAYVEVELLPLLARHLRVTKVTLKNPEVHLIRTEQGNYNISTVGKKRGEDGEPASSAADPPVSNLQGAPITPAHGNPPSESKKAGRAQRLNAIYVKKLVVEKGVIVYEERGPNHQTVTIHDVDLSVKDFSFTRTFDLSLTMAMLSDDKNVDFSGSLGPLAQNGMVDIKDAHLDLKAKLGPIDIARLRAAGSFGKTIPGALSIPDPVSIDAKIGGTPSALKFSFDSDLTGDRVAWAESFDKPASVTFKISAEGSRGDAGLEIARANVRLADLDAKAQRIVLERGNLRARIDTNRFDFASLVKMIPALRRYHISGQGEAHADARVANKRQQANGTISLTGVALSRPEQDQPLVKGLSGEVRLDGDSADAGPLNFDLGAGHAMATMHASSIEPLRANYSLSVDSLKVADLAPKRPSEEHLGNLAIIGTVAQGAELGVDSKVSADEGNLANIAFKDLSLTATMHGKELSVQSLQVSAFNGAIAGNGNATLEDAPRFALNLTANNVDIRSALESQQSKSADMIRGILDAQLKVSGKGATLDAIKPTLAGSGRAAVRNGKLIGINLAAVALDKTKGLPGIGDLAPAALVHRHPELFDNPDTDIDNASLSFVLQGPRITTRDLVVRTTDYGMTGDGWFDMEKSIEMTAHLILTRQFSKEFIAEKKNVVYVTNKDGEVDIPFAISGKLPKPTVIPDIAELAQRAGGHLLEQNGEKAQKAINKLLGKKGKGNPLEQLKGLFH